ncbi:translation initiation factor IF3-1, mitochondrial-like [Phragmites australis]|uniref:translation initiation factor IF3-1, mitochondrial-like n=1 Tax=Phragmites australis TaxID=29695 RepID=UPI002D77B3FD|nr:translation initiation factor IF3-1, mitochondrial-like [Phragmites australis]
MSDSDGQRATIDLFALPSSASASASASVNRKSKEEDDDAAGPRINNAITSPFVTDEAHNVVPRHEALQLAARMGMDLVEVHRKSDPPVCKIMDFHKEKYKKEAKEKERLKTKVFYSLVNLLPSVLTGQIQHTSLVLKSGK